MYMGVPSPLPVNSNPGWVFPKRNFARPTDQAVYTARLVKGLLDFKERIERYTIACCASEGKYGLSIFSLVSFLMT